MFQINLKLKNHEIQFKNYFKLGILLFGVSFVLINCQKEETLLIEDNQVEQSKLKFNTIKGKQIPRQIINYLNQKTNNTLQFNLSEDKIEPILDLSFAREENLEIGTINTSKSSMVINDNNITYSFEMVNSDSASKHNLIVVDMNGDIVNYYIKYKPEATWLETNTMEKNMSTFTGNIMFYNTNGVETGVLNIINGVLDSTTSEVLEPPCNENDTTTNDNTNSTNTGTTSSGSNTGGDNTGTTGGSNTGGTDAGSSTGGGYEAPEVCTFSAGVRCSGVAGHTDPNNPLCIPKDGWSITFEMQCSAINYFRPNGEPYIDPCIGDVGLIIIGEELEALKDEITECLGIENEWVNSVATSGEIVAIHGFLISSENCSPSSLDAINTVIEMMIADPNLDFNDTFDDIFDDQIFLDEDFKNNDCLKSVYDGMGKASTFKNYLQNFEAEFSVAHLRFSSSTTLPTTTNAQTDAVYDALSWVGLKNTIAWNSLTQTERDNIELTETNFNNNNPNCQ